MELREATALVMLFNSCQDENLKRRVLQMVPGLDDLVALSEAERPDGSIVWSVERPDRAPCVGWPQYEGTWTGMIGVGGRRGWLATCVKHLCPHTVVAG